VERQLSSAHLLLAAKLPHAEVEICKEHELDEYPQELDNIRLYKTLAHTENYPKRYEQRIKAIEGKIDGLPVGTEGGRGEAPLGNRLVLFTIVNIRFHHLAIVIVNYYFFNEGRAKRASQKIWVG